MLWLREVDLVDLGYTCSDGQDMRQCVEMALNTERAFWMHRETGNKLECAGHLRELCAAKQETVTVRRELNTAQRDGNAATREALTARRQLGVALMSLKGMKEELDCTTWALEQKAHEASMLSEQLAECRQAMDQLRVLTESLIAAQRRNSEK